MREVVTMDTKKIMYPEVAVAMATSADMTTVGEIVRYNINYFSESEWLTKFWHGIALGFALRAIRKIYEAKTS